MSNSEIAASRPMINPVSLEEIADVVTKSSESFDRSCDRVIDGLHDEAMNLNLTAEERKDNHKMQMDILDKKAEKVTENRVFAAFLICALLGGIDIVAKTKFCGKAVKAFA
jgi:hypothetical protein